jgi:hypothetical protein
VSVLSTLRRLILGETWTLPVGIAAVVLVAAFVVRPMLDAGWDHTGGFVLLAGVCAVLLLSVSSSAGSRPSVSPHVAEVAAKRVDPLEGDAGAGG